VIVSPNERDETRALIIQAVHDAMPEALGEALGPIINRTVAQAIRRTRMWAIVGYIVLAAGLGYVIHDSRARSTQARGVLCEIITKGDASLYAYRHEGLLNKRQLRRSLEQSAEYRRLLGPAPACSPMLTPPPAVVPKVAH
jgi:hypothetical protein